MIDLCHAVTSWDHELVDVEWEEKKENFLFFVSQNRFLIEAKKAFRECLVKAFRNTFQKAFFLNWQGIAQYLSETVN